MTEQQRACETCFDKYLVELDDQDKQSILVLDGRCLEISVVGLNFDRLARPNSRRRRLQMESRQSSASESGLSKIPTTLQRYSLGSAQDRRERQDWFDEIQKREVLHAN